MLIMPRWLGLCAALLAPWPAQAQTTKSFAPMPGEESTPRQPGPSRLAPAQAPPPQQPMPQPMPQQPPPQQPPPQPPPPQQPPTRMQPGPERSQLGAATMTPPEVTSTIGAYCDNGVQDGVESDVDCGGPCRYCGLGEACFDWGDCYSGLCVTGRCQERPYRPGEPVPRGYEVRASDVDDAIIVRDLGLVGFAVGYSAAYFSALSLPSQLGALYVPLLGPWLTLDDVDRFEYKMLLAFDGGLQALGVGLAIGGALSIDKQLVRLPPGALEDFSVVPELDRRGGGVRMQGRF